MAENAPKKSPPLLLVGLALVAAAVAAYFALRSPAPVAPPPPAASGAKTEPAAPQDTALPPLEQRDTSVRSQLAEVSPQLAPYLSQKDLLERWVQVANNLAEDRSPREPLSFLAAPGKFVVSGGTIHAKSYARYDWFAVVVASVDAKKFASAVQTLRPLLTTAYHSLGYPKQSVDELARRSLGRLVRAPVVDGPIEVVESGALYKYKDAKLESLGPVEKHLLRMGAKNEKIVQQKASEVLEALGLPQPTAKQP